MIVHLIDGTYELFRCFYGLRRGNQHEQRFGAVRLVLHTMLEMVETGGTHFGVATDHIIESFRNNLWPGYKTSAGIDPLLWAQFHPLEDALTAFGFATWPMVELEADDALACGAAISARDPHVEKVCIWTPDKDLAQCVVGTRIVQVDRRGGHIRDEAATIAKFGVSPASIPDFLALVGDSADGYPGLPGWGKKSSAAALSKYAHLEHIPRTSGRLALSLSKNWEAALLFRDLATLRSDAPLFARVDELQWKGPTAGAAALAERMGAGMLLQRAERLIAR